MTDEIDDYDVGYGKPPKNTRFARGRSGNPRGRPKGTKNFATMFHEVTQELIRVRENGKDKTMTKLEAAFRQLVGKAMSGDLKATKEICNGIEFSRRLRNVTRPTVLMLKKTMLS